MRETYDEAVELLRSLFSDPLDAIHRAKDERYFKASMLVALAGILFPFVLRIYYGIPRFHSLMLATAAFPVAAFTLWKAGEIIKGRGTFGEMLQVVGLLWLPANIVWFFCGFAKWGNLIGDILYITRLFSDPVHYFQSIHASFTMAIVANLLIWLCVYHVLLVVHRYSDFNTTKYALAEAIVLHWVAWSLTTRLLWWVAYVCHEIFSAVGI